MITFKNIHLACCRGRKSKNTVLNFDVKGNLFFRGALNTYNQVVNTLFEAF